jgi:hypothetical protein
MGININKTKFLRCSRALTENTQPKYYGSPGKELERVDSLRCLGVVLDSRMTWRDHYDRCTKRGSQMLGFVGRTLKEASCGTKAVAYKSLVRPHLEYAAGAWDCYHSGDISAFEAVQRRAARVVTGRWGPDVCVTKVLCDLQWPPLEVRRRERRLETLFRISKGMTVLDLGMYLHPPSYSARNDHGEKIRRYQCRRDYFQNSFFPRSIIEWNAISGGITSLISEQEFRSAVRSRRVNVVCESHA